ncbi:sulfite exporter TauE/SafE family protein [Bosea sp. (in: a-proteobacteria)]|uniref:sulfite exporter TauE/SafE family protein n=1 Tax=Bosea sp. (in: a-proteobacteria) TaxID=1871050 RepID=UPI002608F5F4|nr:sulfite exporter TauE/SafE family protein [Bosea sp. (in: a-proteobacteria)]MCO5091642.1 sulfite exporter TauE/SafE family protein [Bosea sp. (in: a-proteobacteria)]
MTWAALTGFLLLTGMAAYVQTLTGFAFGLITMGGVGLTGLISLPDAAMLVSVLALVNATQMLLKGWREVDWRKFALAQLGSWPCLFIGFHLLGWLAESRADLLRLILGCVIILSSLQLAGRPESLRQPSGPASFLFFGGVGGLMSGMFSAGGPPLVYHFYRQPMSLVVVRETLVAIFALNSLFRTGLVVATDQIPPVSTLSGLFAIPAVMVGTHLARRYPPPISRAVMRRVVFALLFLSGVSLGAPAVIHLTGL